MYTNEKQVLLFLMCPHYYYFIWVFIQQQCWIGKHISVTGRRCILSLGLFKKNKNETFSEHTLARTGWGSVHTQPLYLRCPCLASGQDWALLTLCSFWLHQQQWHCFYSVCTLHTKERDVMSHSRLEIWWSLRTHFYFFFHIIMKPLPKLLLRHSYLSHKNEKKKRKEKVHQYRMPISSHNHMKKKSSM